MKKSYSIKLVLSLFVISTFLFLASGSGGKEYTVCECYMTNHLSSERRECRKQFKDEAWSWWRSSGPSYPKYPKETHVIDTYLKETCFSRYGGPTKGVDY